MPLQRRILQILTEFSYQLLPATCIICQLPAKQKVDLCPWCERDLPWLKHCCYRCALPLKTNENSLLCGACLQQQPPFERSIALFNYATPIDNLLKQLKFHQRLVNAKILGALMARKIASSYQKQALPEIIIPIPLHPRRLRQRGYNQALELARPIANYLHIKIDKFNCRRHRYTEAQFSLNAKQRKQNLRNAFTIKKLPATHIAIVDDVMTTGSTIKEFSYALCNAGAIKVDVWVCARTTL